MPRRTKPVVEKAAKPPTLAERFLKAAREVGDAGIEAWALDFIESRRVWNEEMAKRNEANRNKQSDEGRSK